MSFDDSLEAVHVTPRLTTVSQPLVDIGKQAARLVLEQSAEHKFKAKHITLKEKLMIRDSARALK